jgi:methyl coenzyme M reductase subunit C
MINYLSTIHHVLYRCREILKFPSDINTVWVCSFDNEINQFFFKCRINTNKMCKTYEINSKTTISFQISKSPVTEQP